MTKTKTFKKPRTVVYMRLTVQPDSVYSSFQATNIVNLAVENKMDSQIFIEVRRRVKYKKRSIGELKIKNVSFINRMFKTSLTAEKLLEKARQKAMEDNE